jgi:DNA gyrase subunit A
VRELIAELEALLASEEQVTDKVVEELEELREKYADDRRTELAPAVEALTTEDLIVDEEMIVTITHGGYAKRSSPTLYRAQRRGGKGRTAMGTKEEDFVSRLFVGSTHEYMLFFTNRGRVHWLKVYELPELGRAARGKALVNLLGLGEDERVSEVLPVRDFTEGGFVVLATRRGVLKKTALEAYSNPRRGGIIAINLNQEDELIGAARTSGSDEILLATQGGKSIRFHESQVRPMGRTAAGVKGVAARAGDEAVGMEILRPGRSILTVTRNGYGKRSPLDAYREQNRGGQGIITVKTTARNGPVVGILQVADDDEIMLVTSAGKVIRMSAVGIPVMGRNTQGVRLMEPGSDERTVSVARLAERDEDVESAPAPAPSAGG